MEKILYYPCTKNGKLVKGFCVTEGDDDSLVNALRELVDFADTKVK